MWPTATRRTDAYNASIFHEHGLQMLQYNNNNNNNRFMAII